MNSRVQQVLREARAMVGTVRPQTPCAPAPPSRLASLPIQSSSAANGGASSSSSSTAGNHNNNNNSINNNATMSSSSLFPSVAAGGVSRGDRLASPPGTPPPEMEMLIATDRAAKGLVTRATTVGQQWAKALLSMDARVRHRAAANIFRHCEDELLDMALSAVTRGGSGGVGSGINVGLLKSEGALAALLVIARNPHIHSPNATTNAISPTTANAAEQQQRQHARLTRVSMILAAAAETEGLNSYLVTNGALQTIAELLPKMIFVPSSYSSSTVPAGGGVPSRSGSAAPSEQRSTSPPPPAAATIAFSPSAASLAVPIPIVEQPLTAILNFLTALRALCTEFPHHALKVGLVDPLLRLLSLASSYCLAFASNLLKEKEGGGENNGSADCDEVSGNNDNTQRPRPSSSGAFVSRFAFRPSGAVGTIGGSEAGQAVFEQSAQIVSIAVRIFCQLSFDDECLNDFRLRRDNMLEPLLVYLSFVEPMQDPLLCSRLMLLISRIIDSQEEVCADVVEYHWETVVGKAFECIQKRQQIAQVVSEAMSGALSSSRGGSRGSQRPLTADKNTRPSTSGFSSAGRLANLDEGGVAAVEAAMGASLAASSGASSSMFFTAEESSSNPTVSARSRLPATASASAQAHSFIETITSDAVIAALALLSNVTLVEQGGYTLATSLPHMECLISLINCSSELSDDTETDAKLDASSRVSSASSATKAAPESDGQQELLLREQRKQIAKQKREARTTTIRYGLIVLSNLSYYLPSMPLNDDGDGDGDEGQSDRYDKEGPLLDIEEEEGGGALVAKYGSTKRVNDNDLVGSDDDKGLINLTNSTRATIVTTLALSVCGFLFEGDSEATLEATRILGNLSRTQEGRIWMEENGADEALVLFLGHEDLRLVYNCLGVLLNLTADADADPSICKNSEALSLLLQHTQRIVRATNVPWEIKEVVQMLLRNVQEIESRTGMGITAAFGGESVGEIREGVDEPYPQQSSSYFTDDENVYAMSRGASAGVADASDLGATNAELEALAEGGAE